MSVRYLNATGTQALINEIKTRLATKADASTVQTLANTVSGLRSSIPTKTSDLTNDSDFITKTEASETYASKTSLQSLSQTVQQNATNITILNSTSETEGSVEYRLNQRSITTDEIEELWG